MREMPSRREELIAGALAGDLSDDEQQEFNEARAADPSIDVELAELRAATARLEASEVTWREESPPSGLEERIRRATFEEGRDTDGEDGHSSSYPSS